DRREIAAAEAMHEIVECGETLLLDHACGLDYVLGSGAGLEHGEDRLQGSVCRLVQLLVERGRIDADREAAQHLARILPELRGDLGHDDVAFGDPATRGELAWCRKVRRRH